MKENTIDHSDLAIRNALKQILDDTQDDLRVSRILRDLIELRAEIKFSNCEIPPTT